MPKKSSTGRSSRAKKDSVLWFQEDGACRTGANAAGADAQHGAKERCHGRALLCMHHDLPPKVIAAELDGTLVWKNEDRGWWIALIRFNR